MKYLIALLFVVSLNVFANDNDKPSATDQARKVLGKVNEVNQVLYQVKSIDRAGENKAPIDIRKYSKHVTETERTVNKVKKILDIF